MCVGPEFRGTLNCVLPSHSKCAPGSSTPPAFLVVVKCDHMEVWVGDIVAVLVVDCRDVSGQTLCQRGTESPNQGLSLVRIGLDWKSYAKPFAHSTFLLLRCVVGCLRNFDIPLRTNAFADYQAGGLWPGNISQMPCGLAYKCLSVVLLSLK